MKIVQANIYLYFFLIALAVIGFFFAVAWPHELGFYIFIAFAALGGFLVAHYIYRTKSAHKQLVCPVGSDCNAVVNSKYAKFLGISLEYWGMLYYGVILVSYLLLIFVPHLLSGIFLFGVAMITAIAFLFSLYLLFVQAFLLRQWCIWCLLSAMLSIAIFIVSLATIDLAISFLMEVEIVIQAVRALGFVLGMGSATTTLLLFVKFMRDLDIEEREAQSLKGISEITWLGLTLTLVSHFSFFIIYPEMLSGSGPFLIQTIALFVVAISGAVLMIIFYPLLAMIPFNNNPESNDVASLKHLRRPLFATGATMISSWYFAFVIDYLPEYELGAIATAYVLTLLIAISIVLLFEKGAARKS